MPKATKTRTRRAPAAASAKTSKTTAIARRRKPALPAKVVTPELVPALDEPRNLTDEIMLGGLGLVEVKLTPAEELILSEKVDPGDVQIKPTGQPYLSHPAYTRWFNRAFGRMGWALVPVSKPMKSGSSVVCPYVLYIHGQPAAFANGEQEYHDNNKEQTYGDALEATVASALRRCAKRLGVGLELWDRRWLNDFMRQHGVKVAVMVGRRGEQKRAFWWRRRDDPPFWQERGAGQGPEGEDDEQPQRREAPERQQAPAPRADVRPQKAAHSDGTEDQVITGPQQTRLWNVAQNSGRDESAIKAWLLRRFGYTSSATIKRRDYEFIVAAIEGPNDLPEKRS